MNNFWLRATTGTVFVGLLVSAVLFGGIILYAVLGVFAILGLAEFYALFKKSDYFPNHFGLIIGALLFAAIILRNDLANHILIPLFFLSFAILGIWELFRNKPKPFQNIGITFLGVLYVILPFILLFLMPLGGGLNSENYNSEILLSVFILVWCNDTFAYLIGRALGKHKLLERISPKKTWEGFIGGIIFAVIAGIILALCFELEYSKMVAYGLIVGVFGTLGDLVQSMLKRSLNVKDSGKILPGHGGILDRFDGVIFVIPIIYYLENFVFVQFV